VLYGGLGNSQQPGLEGHPWNGRDGSEPGRVSASSAGSVAQTGNIGNFWGNTWHHCRDNKWRRIPATANAQRVFLGMVDGLQSTVDPIGLASLGFPLAKTIPNRVALLKGYGNAIVPQVAAEFLKAVMNILDNKSAT
jgi:DNA (cytosine-5)-methyltransferase 1